jgi:asparagine synthase (glutamine-hydrolysing)
LLDRIQPVSLNGATRVQEAMYGYFYSGLSAHFHELWDRAAALVGVEERHPFLDRRVAEFAFALPEDQRAHRGLSKIVLRKAMRGGLPRSVEERRLQTDFTPIVTAAVEALGEDKKLFEALNSQGWIVENELFLSLQEVHDKNLTGLWRVWAAAGLNIWYSMAVAFRPADQLRL